MLTKNNNNQTSTHNNFDDIRITFCNRSTQGGENVVLSKDMQMSFLLEGQDISLDIHILQFLVHYWFC